MLGREEVMQAQIIEVDDKTLKVMPNNWESNSQEVGCCIGYVELRERASTISKWRTTLAISGHLSFACLTRKRWTYQLRYD